MPIVAQKLAFPMKLSTNNPGQKQVALEFSVKTSQCSYIIIMLIWQHWFGFSKDSRAIDF